MEFASVTSTSPLSSAKQKHWLFPTGNAVNATCGSCSACCLLRYYLHEEHLMYLSTSLLLFSHSVASDSLRPHGLQPAKLFSPWESPGKNTGVGCHFLLQGIFPTQGSCLYLLHYRQILYLWATWEALSCTGLHFSELFCEDRRG